MSISVPTTPTASSGFWGTWALVYSRTSNRTAIARAYGPRQGMNDQYAAMYALLGATTGGTATKTHPRVAAQTMGTPGVPTGLGGVRTIETVTDINRATTAADLTVFQGVMSRLAAGNPTTYATDASGNGGYKGLG